jgi:sugar phosphate permease
MNKLENCSGEFTGLSPDNAALVAQRPRDLEMNATATRPLKKRVTMMLYLAMCLAFLLIHLDDGILSVASEHIIHDLKFSEADLGLIEAAVYLGLTIGCLLCPVLFARLNPKLLLMLGVLSTSLCVSTWVFFANFWLLMTSRFLNGIFLVSIITRLRFILWRGTRHYFPPTTQFVLIII